MRPPPFDMLPKNAGPDGQQEGLQPGLLRRQHFAGRGRADHPLPRAGRAVRGIRAASIEHDGFQCGYFPLEQMCSAIGIAGQQERLSSALSRDLAARSPEITHDELGEPMTGSLCRCGAHTGRDDRVR